ncbi:hypothetical protein CMV_025693 [Castanea mollissima]|uniref:Disease resistance RPP13-like protein 1 n=1 Tax=Castanea mollissima TaxID=60419 RepID=A0A8J4QDZ4_9ROSI|nr:hypothetical protein CMV_025693 [Castanea mollissima]
MFKHAAEGDISPPSTSTSRSLLPVPSHPFTGTIVWLVNFITEFQNTYLLKKEDAERFFYVERLKECLLMLRPGLMTAHREIDSSSKDKRPFREWYCKVKDLVYEVEDLFEDIELEIRAESYESPLLSCELFEELLEDEDGMDLELKIKYYWSLKKHSHSALPPPPSQTQTLTLWSLLLQRQRRANECLFLENYIPAHMLCTVKRMSLIMAHLENLVEEMHSLPSPSLPPFSSSSSSTEDPGYHLLPWYLRRCLEFCFIFTPGFTFYKKDLVLFWVAGGLVHPVAGRSLEEEAGHYFDLMVSWNYFLLAYPDHPEPGLTSLDLDLDPPLYKLRFDWINIDRFTMDHEFVRHCLFDGLVSEKARHASVGNCSISEGWLQPSRGLRTIFLRRRGTHCYSNSSLNGAGRLFLKVRYLRILDLSHAGFKSLPDYVCDLLHLRSLNLSYNPIETLSRSIINLFRLQTLNLFRCHELTSIPDNLYLLSNLRHLIISPVKLNLMPTFIGRFTSLQTLLQFTVLRKDGCQIGELRNLNDLCGELSIENLENVATLDEAKGARLHLKTGIHKLSLVWSGNEPNANFDIAQGLRPHCNLKVLKIFNYNSKFPSWVSNPSFAHLISITLTNCLSQELPPFGPLPLLKSLQIVNVNGVKHIGPKFYGWGIVKIAFPSLLSLKIWHMNDLETWSQCKSTDFPVLKEIYLSSCKKLKSLPKMRPLDKIKTFNCPKFSHVSGSN